MFFKRPPNNLLTAYLQQSGAELLDDLNFFKKRRRARRRKNFKISLAGLSLIITFLILNAAIFIPSLRTAYQLAKQGREHLDAAVLALQNGQVSQGLELSRQASDEWRGALLRWQRFRFTPLAWLPYLSLKSGDLGRLLEAGFKLARANFTLTQSGVNYWPLLFASGTDFIKLPLAQQQAILEELKNSSQPLSLASQDLTDALSNLENITSPEIFTYLTVEQTRLIETVRYNKQVIDKIMPLSQLLPALLGYPQAARYLLIFQNRDELRPTGGFIGTVGLMEVASGNITRLDTKDVYHLDMPASEAKGVRLPEPPEQLRRYLSVDAWYLRDANWSPDWTQSAQQIEKFYLSENQLNPQPDPMTDFDFVVGITPDLIIDLLKISGPIILNNQVYDQYNFIELLQDTTGREFTAQGISSWERKVVIGQLAKLLQQKILTDLTRQWQPAATALLDNLNAKNILIYAKAPEIDYLLRQRHWVGAVESAAGDYLMVVDANLAALKTDAVINRYFTYQLRETAQGLKARLTLNYANTGIFSWKTTRYRSYTRVYLPIGSRLLLASGYMSETVDSGEELGKTWFGAFVSVEPGALGNLTFEYLLPEAVKANYQLGQYQLLWQKQPGSKVSSAKVDLQFLNKLKSYEPARFYAQRLGESRVVWQSDLSEDENFSVNF